MRLQNVGPTVRKVCGYSTGRGACSGLWAGIDIEREPWAIAGHSWAADTACATAEPRRSNVSVADFRLGSKATRAARPLPS